ncbi:MULTISPECIES: 2-methylaconitate cis-trans isomerase PrpF family protein [unclassified Mycobacterium]|uniref:2-methylaconitate cis-trans isomerase PrpF family protein n=1 Tax=unclassified Mycobacterium TaxID=2642494 RepID=UPI0029C8D16C|nr:MULTISPECIES: PrpF domain-containing protein [unclassified Mycobacterium]
MSELLRIPSVLMRGGTSKAVFFTSDALPRGDQGERDRIILAAFGSGDPRQIDGLGGADVLTSKVAIIGPPSRPDADVDYTFGQVGIDENVIDWNGNCGNISSAVGVYAIEEGFVEAVEPVTSIRVHNTNTASLLRLMVPVADGRPRVDGDFAISGVPGTGAEIRLDFAATAGATTGKMLPTGSAADVLRVEGIGELDVSIVDVAKLAVFFRAESVGLTGAEGPSAFTGEVLAKFEAVQQAAADLVGVDRATGMPRPVAVAPAQEFYRIGDATTPVSANDADFLGRWVVVPPPRVHKAFAGTGAVCTGVAACVEGSVVHQVRTATKSPIVRIGHPSGVFPVRIELVDGELREASFSRTARRLMEGNVFVRSAAT